MSVPFKPHEVQHYPLVLKESSKPNTTPTLRATSMCFAYPTIFHTTVSDDGIVETENGMIVLCDITDAFDADRIPLIKDGDRIIVDGQVLIVNTEVRLIEYGLELDHANIKARFDTVATDNEYAREAVR